MALIILRRWKDGLAEYRSLIFANKSGPVSRLEDLRGKLIVFEDPGSTSGYFLPKMLLLKKGFKVTEKAGPKAKVAPGEIGYFFESTDRISIDYVLSGEAAAGAFSDDDHGALDASKKAAINVLAQSETLPRHLVSTRKDLDPAVRARLIEILLSMHLDDEGRKILQKTDNTSKFDRLPGGEDRVRRKLIDIFRFRVTK
jgi:phosphonate transport system substrate-binding protein